MASGPLCANTVISSAEPQPPSASSATACLLAHFIRPVPKGRNQCAHHDSTRPLCHVASTEKRLIASQKESLVFIPL